LTGRPGPPPLSWRSPKTEVRASGIHGRGLFAVEPIAAGEVVCVKGGAIFDRATLESRAGWYAAAEIQVDDELYIGPSTEAEREGAMLFLNHSCEPSVGVRGQVVFAAMRDLAPGEELTIDYATTDDDDSESACACGAAGCRKVLSGRDWRRPELQARYAGWFSSYLEVKIRRGDA